MNDELLREYIRKEIKEIVMSEGLLSSLGNYFSNLMQGVRDVVDGQIEQKKSELDKQARNSKWFKEYVKDLKMSEQEADMLFKRMMADADRKVRQNR